MSGGVEVLPCAAVVSVGNEGALGRRGTAKHTDTEKDT